MWYTVAHSVSTRDSSPALRNTAPVLTGGMFDETVPRAKSLRSLARSDLEVLRPALIWEEDLQVRKASRLRRAEENKRSKADSFVHFVEYHRPARP